MDQLIFNNFLSMTVGLILMSAVHYISFQISKKFFFVPKNDVLNYVVSVNLVLISISILTFFLFLFKIELDIKRFIFLLGFVYFLFNRKNTDIKKLIIFNRYEYLIIFLFLILALCPPSDADSLDYHLGFAVSAIENNAILIREDWLHYRLFGYGEYLNLFGLLFYSKHFGQLVNFYAFYLICLIFKSLIVNQKIKMNLVFYFFSTPLLIWLVYSSKPQLLLCQIFLLAFIFILDVKLLKKNLLLINMMIIYTVSSKISFIFSTIIILSFIFYESYKNKFFLKYLSNLIIATIIIMLPIMTLKYGYYGDIFPPLFETLKKTPDPAITEFLFTISKDQATFYQIKPYYSLILPLFATLPLTAKLITAILGLGFNLFYLTPIYIKNILKSKNLSYSLIFIGTSIIFFSFQNNFQPRYLMEAYLINGIMVSLILNKKDRIIKIINISYYVVTAAILLILIPIIFSYFYVNFNGDSYKKTMRKIANNYSEIEWVKKNISMDDVVASQTTRSHALIDYKFVTRERLFQFNYVFRGENRKVNFDKDKIELIDLFKKFNVTKLVVKTKQTQPEFIDFLKKCTNFEFVNESKLIFTATRNPFSELRKNSYELKIVENKCLN